MGPLTLAVLAALLLHQAPLVEVRYPTEGMRLGEVRSTYLYGRVRPAEARITVNGVPAVVHPRGGFLVNVPVRPGEVSLRVKAHVGGRSTSVERRVHVEPSPEALTEDMPLPAHRMEPSGEVRLGPGEPVPLQVVGPPRLQAHASVEGGAQVVPLVEGPAGFYRGVYWLAAGERLQAARVRFTLEGGRRSLTAVAPGSITLLEAAPRVAQVRPARGPWANIRGAPSSGYLLFAPGGTRLLVSGQMGKEARVVLGPGLSGYVRQEELSFLPEGTPPPRATVGTVRASARKDASVLQVALTERVPYQVEEEPGLVRLRFFSADAHTSWVAYEARDRRVRDIRATQESEAVTKVEVRYAADARLAGYDVRPSPGGVRLELRWARRSRSSRHPLRGRTIVLDAGHSPSEHGHVGPSGVPEHVHNLSLARRLAAALRHRGARVVMTHRRGAREVTLHQRVQRAWAARGEVLISLHANALPHGANPFSRPRGFSVFYYHPHSRELAESLHTALRRRIQLPDGGLFFADLFIPRMTQMPAVLIESGYFIFPEQEAALLDEGFQRRLVTALSDALSRYFARGDAQAARAIHRGRPR